MKNKNKTHRKAKCNSNKLVFSSVKRRKILADFNGGKLTSDVGLLALREVDKQIGSTKQLSQCIIDNRHPGYVKHSITQMLRQRIYAIAAGYEDLNDHQTLRNDPVIQAVAEHHDNNALASAPTLCRLENNINREALQKISEVFVERFIASHKQPPKELVLDFDATDDPVHGGQVGRFFHGYYDHYCFLPLYVFCGGQLLVSYLRPSKIDAAKHSRAILKLLVKRFQQAWPDVKIIFRGDSGFCRWKLLGWCEKHNVYYIVGLAKNSVLTNLGQSWIQKAQEQFQDSEHKQRIFGEFEYAAGTWDRERRVIIKAEHLEQGPNTRFIVTNLSGESQHLYDDIYCQRGDMENRIKEQQLDLFSDRTSCHEFDANQFRVFLSAAAYILIETLRRVYLKDTELARAQVGTIRIKLLKVAARVVHKSSRILFHICSSYPYHQLLTKLICKLIPWLNPSFNFT